MDNKFLRVGGNPNNNKDWEQCSGDPTCPRHVHVNKNAYQELDELIKQETQADMVNFIKAHPLTLEEKNRYENHSIASVLIPAATVGITSAGGAVYTAVQINNGPIYYGLAIGLGFMFGVMGAVISGIAAHYTNHKATVNMKSKPLIKHYENATGTKLSKQEIKFFKQNINLELTEEEHKQNQLNALAEQDKLNKKYLEEYNSPFKNS